MTESLEQIALSISDKMWPWPKENSEAIRAWITEFARRLVAELGQGEPVEWQIRSASGKVRGPWLSVTKDKYVDLTGRESKLEIELRVLYAAPLAEQDGMVMVPRDPTNGDIYNVAVAAQMWPESTSHFIPYALSTEILKWHNAIVKALSAAAQSQIAALTTNVSNKTETLERYREQIAALEAQIDRLMLEYCPDEMTPEQKANWEKHQKAVPEGESNER